MTDKDAIKKLKELIKPIGALLQMPHGNEEFKKWHRCVVIALRHIYPSHISQIKSFVSIRFTLRQRYYMARDEWKVQRAYEHGLQSARALLESLMEEITEYGLENNDGSIDKECMHPDVDALSKKAMQADLYADAVERAFKAINSRVKKMVKGQVPAGDDGVKLMQEVFSEKTPLIRVASDDDPSGADVQRGYMFMFAGGMSAIRNPKAHDNIEIDRNDALRKLYFASMLMYKLDEAEQKGWIVNKPKGSSGKK